MLIFYVQGADKRAMANTETQDIYVVQKDIPAGTSVSKFGDTVAKKAVPKSAIAENSVSNLSELGSKVSAIEFKPGEQLLQTRLVETSALLGPGRIEVPTGLQEVTVKLGIDRVVGGALSAGDTVGVLLSFAGDDKANAPAQTQLTYHKVLVTAVQTSTGDAKTTSQASGDGALSGKQASGGGDFLVTLARPSADVERIVFAAEYGKVYLTKEPANATEGNTGVVDRTKVYR